MAKASLFSSLGSMVKSSSLAKTINADPFAAGKMVGASAFSIMGGARQGAALPNPYDYNPYGGALQMQQIAVDQEAELLERQAELALSESIADAENTADEGRHFREQQALNYQHQGVLLEGSPMLVLEETRRKVKNEVDAILQRGNAQNDVLRRQAGITRNQGRASILGQQAQFGMSRALFNIEQLAARQRAGVPGGGLAAALDGLGGIAFGNRTGALSTPTGSKRVVSPKTQSPLSAAPAPTISRQYGYTFQPWQG